MASAYSLWSTGKHKECLEAVARMSTRNAASQVAKGAETAQESPADAELDKILAALAATDKDVAQQAGSSALEDPVPAVIKLNLAILLAQHNKPTDAVKVLEPLFQAIEPMQESIAVRVCLLLVELYLSFHSFGPAAKVVHYLETAYGVMVDSPEDRESLAGQNSDLELGTDAAQSVLEPLAVTDTPHSPSRGPSESTGGQPANVLSPPKSDSISSGVTEEGEIAAVLGRMLDQAGRLDTHPATQGNGSLEVGGIPMVQLVRILRAKLNLALNQLRSARRDIKAIMAADPNSPQGMSLRAQLELQRQSYRKSARILTLSPSADPNLEGPSRKESPSPDKSLVSATPTTSQATQQQDSVQHVAMLSNMGAVQHAQGKHHTSALCYAQALQRCAHLSDKITVLCVEADLTLSVSIDLSQCHVQEHAELPSSRLPHNAELQMAYSAGLQALQLGNYSTALHCFQVATVALHMSPALWLRMADCCMGVLQQPSTTADYTAQAAQMTALAGQEGWRQAVQSDATPSDSSSQQSDGACMQSIQQAQLASQSRMPSGFAHSHRQTQQQHQAWFKLGSAVFPHKVAVAQHDMALRHDLEQLCVQLQSDPGTAAHPALVKFATQCLQNSIFLCHQALHQHSALGSDPQPAQARGSHATLDGVAPPSNGHREAGFGPARSTLGKGSAAEAAEQLAMLSLDRSRAASSAMDAAVATAAEQKRQQLLSIQAAALANLAWLLLQQQSWRQAQQTCQALLQVPGLSQEHQVLALSYTAEAVCHLEGTAQAAQHLQEAVALQQISSNGNHTQAAAAVNSSASPEEEAGVTKALQVAVLVNAASLAASQGHLQQAQEHALEAAVLQSNSQQALLVLIYVELCKGNCGSAMNLLKQQQVSLT